MRERILRSPFNYVRVPTLVNCTKEEDRAVQSQREEADINVIMRRFGVTGVLPEGTRMPVWGQDWPEGFDFRYAQDLIAAGRDAFMALPAEVRSKFSNDPALFIDFCSDEVNRAQLEKWGFITPKAAPVEPVKPVA